MNNFDALPWSFVVVIGAILLGAALAYGMWINSRRTRADKMVTEAATRREYKEEDRDRPNTHMPT